MRAILAADPKRVVTAGPVLIDEWQRLPVTWDVVRRAVDDRGPAGPFLLTGSASQANPGTHSGAGRILKVRMRPLSLAERRPGTSTGRWPICSRAADRQSPAAVASISRVTSARSSPPGSPGSAH